jgi:hypothetical protein
VHSEVPGWVSCAPASLPLCSPEHQLSFRALDKCPTASAQFGLQASISALEGLECGQGHNSSLELHFNKTSLDFDSVCL